MKLSDYKGEAAIDLLADIIEPMALIIADEEIQAMAKKSVPYLSYVKPILKNHKKEIVEILARIDNEPVDVYTENITFLTLPVKILDFLNDPEIQSLFQSQVQASVTPVASFGLAMENTGAAED